LYFLLDLVEELDLSEILTPAQAKDPRGKKVYDPLMLSILLLYANCVGTVSCLNIERTIFDATIIHAPSSTKNKKGERDPEMHSLAVGNQRFFGMRCHIEVDAASGLVHSVVSTAANVHELNTSTKRLHGVKKVVYGDSGHLGIEKRQ
jgi:IS5 family transposase